MKEKKIMSFVTAFFMTVILLATPFSVAAGNFTYTVSNVGDTFTVNNGTSDIYSGTSFGDAIGAIKNDGVAGDVKTIAFNINPTTAASAQIDFACTVTGSFSNVTLQLLRGSNACMVSNGTNVNISLTSTDVTFIDGSLLNCTSLGGSMSIAGGIITSITTSGTSSISITGGNHSAVSVGTHQSVTISNGSITSISVSSGTANISGGTIKYVIASNGGTVTVTGGNFGGTTLGSRAVFTSWGVGTINVTNADITISENDISSGDGITVNESMVTSGNEISIIGGDVLPTGYTVASGKTLNIPSGATVVSNGIINNGTINTYGSMVQAGGTLTNNGVLNVDGQVTVDSPILNNGTIDNSGTINLYNTLTNSSGKNITNSGEINVSDDGELVNNGTISNSGIVRNNGTISGTGTMTGNGVAARYAVTPTSIDFGTVSRDAQTTTVGGQSVINIPKTISIQNNSEDSATFAGEESSDFYSPDLNDAMWVGSTSSKNITVYPRASVLNTSGIHNGTMSISRRDGTETFSTALQVTVGSEMPFVLSSDEVNFGAVTRLDDGFSPSSKSITVTNESGASAVISALSGDYFTTSISNEADGVTVAAGETYTIYFYIKPTVSDGSYSEIIYFSCNGVDTPYEVTVGAAIGNQHSTTTSSSGGGTTVTGTTITTEKEAVDEMDKHPNTTVNVDFSNTTKDVITKEMLESAKKNNIDLTVKLNNRLTVEISSDKIIEPKDLDLNALITDTVLSNIVNSENLKTDIPSIIGVDKPDETITTYMDIPYSGLLGVTVKFKVRLPSTVKNKKYANIFKLVESADEKDTLKTTSAANDDDIISLIQMLAEKKSKTVKPKKSVEIINWDAIFNLDSASEYIIVVTDNPLINEKGELVNGRLSDLTVGAGTTGCEEQLG